MTKYIFSSLLVIFFSCGQNNNSSLEISFTSKDMDIVQELKAFHLTSLTTKNKTITFNNVKSISTNKFVFNNLDNDIYIGLMLIEKNGMVYNISIDSIQIKNGKNVISKDINLGTVQL